MKVLKIQSMYITSKQILKVFSTEKLEQCSYQCIFLIIPT